MCRMTRPLVVVVILVNVASGDLLFSSRSDGVRIYDDVAGAFIFIDSAGGGPIAVDNYCGKLHYGEDDLWKVTDIHSMQSETHEIRWSGKSFQDIDSIYVRPEEGELSAVAVRRLIREIGNFSYEIREEDMAGERIVDFQQFDTNNDGLGGRKYWVADDVTIIQILVKQGDARGFPTKFFHSIADTQGANARLALTGTDLSNLPTPELWAAIGDSFWAFPVGDEESIRPLGSGVDVVDIDVGRSLQEILYSDSNYDVYSKAIGDAAPSGLVLGGPVARKRKGFNTPTRKVSEAEYIGHVTFSAFGRFTCSESC